MRNGLERLGLRDRVGARVGFEVCENDVLSTLCGNLRVSKHLEGLAHTGRIAQINFQATAWSRQRFRHMTGSVRKNSYVDTVRCANQTENRISEKTVPPRVVQAVADENLRDSLV